MNKAKPSHLALAALLYIIFAVFLVWPIAQVVRTGFVGHDGYFTFQYVQLIFSDPVLVRGLINAALVAICVTVITAVISLPLAVLSVRYDFRARGFLSGLLLVPLVLPPFVGAMGIRMILGRFGTLTNLVSSNPSGIDWLGRWRLVGVILVESLGLFPIMLLNLQAALANIDPAMHQAAANLGASRWTIFRRITFPLLRPGLLAGGTLVTIWSFTELGTPLMFDFYTITPVQVFAQMTDVMSNPLPYALVVVMLFASLTLYLIGKVALGRSFDAATTKASVQAQSKKLTGWRTFAAALPFLIVIAFALLPHVAVILTSISQTGAWYKSLFPSHFTSSHFIAALQDELAFPSVKRSLLYAAAATFIAMWIGLAAAILIVRSKVPGRGLIDAMAMLPLAVPGLVLAFGYLAMSVHFKQRFGAATPAFLDVQEWSVLLLVIAYAARRLPYVVRSAVAGLQQTPVDLELAGANLGATKWRVLSKITLPLIAANLIAGALLAFAFAMLEVSDSLVLAQQQRFYPITKAIWELSQRLGDGIYIASSLGVWAMALLTLTLLTANAMLGKKMGAIFRV